VPHLIQGGEVEIRKVQVTGGSSYVISLPKAWIKSSNVKKNDPLGIITQPDGTLLITPNVNEKRLQRTKEFDVDSINEPTHLFRCLIGAYISGYTTIKIKSSRTIPPFVRTTVRKFANLAIGQEVIEETATSITIKDILDPVEMPFENTIRRMYVIVKNMHKDAISALKNKDKALAEDVVLRDDEVDRLHWLIVRQQNIVSKNAILARRMGITTGTIANYSLISRIIERIGDHAVRISKNVLNLIDRKIDEEVIDTLVSASNFALEIFNKSVESFFKRDMEAANRNIDSITKLVSYCEDISTFALQQKGKTAISVGYIIESIKRTGEYAGDLSEYVINYLVEDEM